MSFCISYLLIKSEGSGEVALEGLEYRDLFIDHRGARYNRTERPAM